MAAERFVLYWECRRDLFGSDKFHLRMTLSEALRDDVPTLMAGAFCLLPHLDLSGRHLIFVEPHRMSFEGYTAESMVSGLRCVFGVIGNVLTHTAFQP